MVVTADMLNMTSIQTQQFLYESFYNAMLDGCYKHIDDDDNNNNRFIPLQCCPLTAQYSSPAEQLHWHFSSWSHRSFPDCTYIDSIMTLAGYLSLTPVKWVENDKQSCNSKILFQALHLWYYRQEQNSQNIIKSKRTKVWQLYTT